MFTQYLVKLTLNCMECTQCLRYNDPHFGERWVGFNEYLLNVYFWQVPQKETHIANIY